MKPQRWVQPSVASTVELDRTERRLITIEIVVVLLVTFGWQGLRALLSFIESALAGLADQQIALNPTRSHHDLIDFSWNLISILKLASWIFLGLYLLWRSGFGFKEIGLSKIKWRSDALPGIGLAILIGLPGLGFYILSRTLGLNTEVIPSSLNETWWQIPVLTLTAIGNSGAEEVIVVAFLLTRLRQLGTSANSALIYSALLRASYHLYQGIGAAIGNLIMGLIFGRYWQCSNRLWPLLIAHSIIDIVAFVGYALMKNHLTFIP
ncbi:MAG: CPBP family intramembrane glutamic endopeptidase [Mycobacteriaceae bacterium]